MSDSPIGPIIGAGLGLLALGATVQITKSILDQTKEQSQPRKKITPKPLTTNTDTDRVQRGLEKMLYR